jgi:ribosome-associated protein
MKSGTQSSKSKTKRSPTAKSSVKSGGRPSRRAASKGIAKSTKKFSGAKLRVATSKKKLPSATNRAARRKQDNVAAKRAQQMSSSVTFVAQDPRSQDLALKCAKALIDKKAEQTTILNVGQIGSFTDYFLISSGSNEKQVQAMADTAVETLKANGYEPAVEGYEQGRWVLVDAGSIVLHLFHDDIRGFYNLEDLWTGAPRLPIPQDYYLN